MKKRILENLKMGLVKARLPFIKKRNLKNLEMGLVKANFVCIHKKQKSLWVERGFEEQRNYPIFLHKLKRDETVMLGIPKTIIEFGINNFVNAKVLEASTCFGTYGMGGPGFFGLLCDTKQGHFELTLTIWGSGQYVMMDGRVIECHPVYIEQYNPWIQRTDKELNSILIGAVINSIELSAAECKMILKFIDNTEHEIVIYRYNKNLPPM